MLRVAVTDSLLPLIGAGTVLVFALCLAAMGIRKFFDQPVAWRGTVLITGLTCAGPFLFTFGYDSVPMRISIYSIAQTLPLVLSLKLLLTPQDGRISPGARLAGIVASPHHRASTACGSSPACCISAVTSPSCSSTSCNRD